MSRYIVTGAAGFIGSFLCKQLLLDKNNLVIGIDNLNDYYDINLKKYRLSRLKKCNNFIFSRTSLENKDKIFKIFKKYKADYVINLAAQAGVRYSIDNPDTYILSNIVGFFNILEACRKYPVKHLVFASSSSIYGNNEKIPFSTEDKTDRPISLYAATKKSNELLAYSYSHLYNIPATGLRFFTVYGPAGRPDMAYFKFTNKLIHGDDIEIYNNGQCMRDFTFVDDVVKGILKVIPKPPRANKQDSFAVYNIGHGSPINLLDFINILQEELLKVGLLPENYDFEAKKKFIAAQPGDVESTFADTDDFEKVFHYKPETSLRDGIAKFAAWYKEYYG